jgi:transcriptional regulator with XRE-family HTH domain
MLRQDHKEALVLRSKVLGILLRKARIKAGKSQKECAQALHCSPHTISQYERGRKGISLPELEVLSYLFDVPLTCFWDEDAVFEEAKKMPPLEKVIMRRKIIGVMLRQARLEAGLTQKECARALGCPASRISQYERGERDLPLAELEVLADLCQAPITYFLDDQLFPTDQTDDLERLAELPPDVKDFVLEALNLPYIQAAMRLSNMSVEALREFAANLLDITY